MNFEKEYRREMDCVLHNAELDKEILDITIKENEIKRGDFLRWRAVAAGVAIVLVVAAAMNWGNVITYAESLYGSFSFSLNGDVILLDEITPLDFNYEMFSAKTEPVNHQFGDVYVTDGSVYGGAYENEDSLLEETGIELPGAKQLDYGIIMMSLSDSRTVGHISTNVIWNGTKNTINAYFLTELYNDGKVGYGERFGICTAYEYADGKWAYFTTGNGYEPGTVQRVYFSMDGFVFQLFVEDSQEGTSIAKEILKAMSE
ncbi:MAG: hypothetical protein E7283_02885 [Lachnospiraceae bacterium]|nr:hypothetical protein [Lachnospiraceae bacterium]